MTQTEQKDNGMDSLPDGDEKILVVDDDLTIIYLEKMMLEKLGYQVTSRTDSLDAFALFENAPNGFDLVITDQAMPDMTGEEFIKKILTLRPEMPIILNSGYSADFTRDKAASIGVSEYIVKPLDFQQLAHAVRQALDSVLIQKDSP